MKSYKKKLIEEKEVPLGFNIPVVYVRRSDTVDASSFELSRISDIQESQYYMDSAYADMLINTLGGSYHYENGLAMDNAAKELIQDVVKHTKSNIKLENSEKAMDSRMRTASVEVPVKRRLRQLESGFGTCWRRDRRRPIIWCIDMRYHCRKMHTEYMWIITVS